MTEKESWGNSILLFARENDKPTIRQALLALSREGYLDVVSNVYMLCDIIKELEITRKVIPGVTK